MRPLLAMKSASAADVVIAYFSGDDDAEDTSAVQVKRFWLEQ